MTGGSGARDARGGGGEPQRDTPRVACCDVTSSRLLAVAYGSSRPCSHMGWLHVSHTKLRFDIRPKGILILARQRALVHTFVELLKMELMSC